MKFSTKDFFSGSDQIRRKHLCRVVLVSAQIWFCRSRSSGAAAVHVLYGGSALLGGRLWHRCFSMNFAKFLGVSFFIGRFWCLLLVSSFNLVGIWMPPAVVSPWYWGVLWCGMCRPGSLGACGLCPESRAPRVRVSPSKFYPADKLQWHFTCGFDFGHSLWLPFVATFAVRKGLRRNARTSCEKC